MKFALVFAAVLAVSAAQYKPFGQAQARLPARPTPPAPRPPPSKPVVGRVASNDQAATITRYDNDASPDGSFNYVVETDNGISAQAQGTPRDFGGNPPVVPVVIQGAFAWTSPEGQPIAISYTADEDGYKATGDAIPTPHPIPEAILKSLRASGIAV